MYLKILKSCLHVGPSVGLPACLSNISGFLTLDVMFSIISLISNEINSSKSKGAI